MSDIVTVAVITAVGNLLVVAVSRWMSHCEHKQTSRDVREIKVLLNGVEK